MKLASGALASLVVLTSVSPAGAQIAAGTPFTVGDLVVSGAIRSRTYSWNWFGDLPEGDYWHQGTQIRLGVSRSKKRYDWQLEFEVPFMLHLPTTAVKAAPQGQLGLGAAYFAANDGNANPVGLFLKQGFVRFNGLGGIVGQSLRVGRMEFNDGLEVAPRNGTLAVIKRDRISQRLIGNFGFSDVLRSLDGVQYVLSLPTLNVTALAARPTEGVFQVNGWSELNVNVFYGALTGQAGSERSPGEWRLIGLAYDDYRHGIAKADNRPVATRITDSESIRVGTYGGHYLHVSATPAGSIDVLLWGALQTGAWGTLSHRAGAFAAEAGWQPARPHAWQPWIRGGYNYGSGDTNPDDDTHGTFFQVLPTARIYARTPFFNLMNSVDAFGELVLRPSNRVTLRADLHSIRLASNNDLWYSGGGAFQAGTFGYNGRTSNGQTRLGTLYDLSGDITLNRHVGLGLYYACVRSQDVARAIFPAGSGARFGFVEWQFRF